MNTHVATIAAHCYYQPVVSTFVAFYYSKFRATLNLVHRITGMCIVMILLRANNAPLISTKKLLGIALIICVPMLCVPEEVILGVEMVVWEDKTCVEASLGALETTELDVARGGVSEGCP